MWTQGEKGRVGRIEKVAVTYTHYHVKKRLAVGSCCMTQGASLAFCDVLHGWDGMWVGGSRGILKQKKKKQQNLILKILKKSFNNLTLKICSNKGKMDEKKRKLTNHISRQR